MGVFILAMLGLLWLFRVWTQRTLEGPLALGILLLALGYGGANAGLIRDVLSTSPTIWHRVEFAPPDTTDGRAVLRDTLHLVFRSHYHADADPFPVVWATLLLGVSLGVVSLAAPLVREGRSGMAEVQRRLAGARTLRILLVLLSSTALVGVMFFVCSTSEFRQVIARIPGLREFNFSRAYWFLPVIMYVSFFSALRIIARWRGYSAALALFLALTQVGWNLHDREWRERADRADHIRYSRFESRRLFQKTVARTGMPLERLCVACVGFYPAMAMLNGLRTVGGYWYLYPLEYKKRFRPVIAGELEKSRELANYFDRWGSRCYLFSSELGTQRLVRKERGRTLEELALNVEALRGLGTTHVLSAVALGNHESLGLVDLGKVEDEGAAIDLFIYGIGPGS